MDPCLYRAEAHYFLSDDSSGNICGTIPNCVFDESNLSIGECMADMKLIIELGFRVALRKNHLHIVIGRGQVRLKQYAI